MINETRQQLFERIEKANCGDCIFYKNGSCHVSSPEVFDATGTSAFPNVKTNDFCSFFTEISSKQRMLERMRRESNKEENGETK